MNILDTYEACIVPVSKCPLRASQRYDVRLRASLVRIKRLQSDATAGALRHHRILVDWRLRIETMLDGERVSFTALRPSNPRHLASPPAIGRWVLPPDQRLV